MRLYVGNMSYNSTEDTLRAEFGRFGQVDDVHIVMDRETGRPRGFAFVTLADEESGRKAIEEMNGTELDGRTLTVNEARPREDRGGRGGGGGGGFRGGRGGGGGGGRGRDNW